MPRVLVLRRGSPEPGVIEQTVGVLRGGGVIVYPTETLYGLGGDALNSRAVERVSAAKGRKDGKPILLLADSSERALLFVRDVSPLARRVMERCWPGPLTLVLPAAPGLPDAVTAGTGTVGIRVPGHALCREIVRALGRPITSTSANLSGGAVPSSVAGLVDLFGDRVDLYLDGGPPGSAAASTVLDLSGPVPGLVRAGAFPLESLRLIIPALQPASPEAPGGGPA